MNVSSWFQIENDRLGADLVADENQPAETGLDDAERHGIIQAVDDGEGKLLLFYLALKMFSSIFLVSLQMFKKCRHV